MSKELLQELMDRSLLDKHREVGHFNTYNIKLGYFFKDQGMEGDIDFAKPETLRNISALGGDHNGYKVFSMESAAKEIKEIVLKTYKKEFNEVVKKNKEIEKMERAQEKDVEKGIKSFVTAMNINEEKAESTRMIETLRAKVNDKAGDMLGGLLMNGVIAYKNKDNEVRLLEYGGDKFYAMDPAKVEVALPDPDTRSRFRKFIDKVKDFFGAKKTQQELDFIEKKDVFEFKKAQRKVLGIEAPEKEAAQKEKQQNKSAEKAEPNRTEPKKETPEKPKEKGM